MGNKKNQKERERQEWAGTHHDCPASLQYRPEYNIVESFERTVGLATKDWLPGNSLVRKALE